MSRVDCNYISKYVLEIFINFLIAKINKKAGQMTDNR